MVIVRSVKKNTHTYCRYQTKSLNIVLQKDSIYIKHALAESTSLMTTIKLQPQYTWKNGSPEEQILPFEPDKAKRTAGNPVGTK